jgi:hypothetical protein
MEGGTSDEKSHDLELLVISIVANSEIRQSPKRAHFEMIVVTF